MRCIIFFEIAQIYYLKLETFILRFGYHRAVSTGDTVYIIAGFNERYYKAIHKFHNMEWTSSIGRLQHASSQRGVIRFGNDILIVSDKYK